MSVIAAGTWVQIQQTLLKPEKRAPQIPEDTKKTPLIMLAKGFLKQDSRIGDPAAVETIIGRTIHGKLVAVNPPYEHGFGAPIPELLHVGRDFHEILFEEGR